MQKIIDRLQLFLSSWAPGEIYQGAVILLALVSLIILILGFVRFLHKGRWVFNLLAVPTLISFFVLVSSLSILFTERVSGPICLLSGIGALVLSYLFLGFISGDESEKSHLLIQIPIESNTGTFQRVVFYIGLALLYIFFLLSIDHNYLPPQYDITTYQFFSDLVARHGTYPVIDFAGENQLNIIPPPGYFGIDYLMGMFWDSPRRVLLTSSLFLLGVILTFVRLGTVLFKDVHLELFILFATFSRGLFWTYWEFNVQRELSLIAALMFLLCSILSYRTDGRRKRIGYLVFGQLFLTAAFMCHPENTAYILVGIFALIGFNAIRKAIERDNSYLLKMVQFALSMGISLMVLLYWHISVVQQYTVRNYMNETVFGPVPDLLSFLFHTNGVIPVLALLLGILLMVSTNRKKEGVLFCFLFIFMIFLVYFKYLLHLLMPETFELLRREYSEFTSASLYVKGPLVHPDSTIVKITSLWWFMILVLGWTYSYLWKLLRRKNLVALVSVGLLYFPLVVGDVIYLYYNQPIISGNGYRFLLSLEDRISDDAIIIAPAQYQFSAWTGPLLRRDSLAFRGEEYHATHSMGISLYGELVSVYASGDFEPILSKLPRERVVILFDDARTDKAIQLLKSGKWETVFEQNGYYALGWRI